MHFRLQKESRSARQLRSDGWSLGASILIFFALSGIIPLYNKVIFDGAAGDRGFPYPISLSFLQLSFCAVSLFFIDVGKRFFFKFRLLSRKNALEKALQKVESELGAAELQQIYDENLRSLSMQAVYLAEERARSQLVNESPPLAEVCNDESFDSSTRLLGTEISSRGSYCSELLYRCQVARVEYETFVNDSWMCGPNFGFKCREAAAIGTLFGLKYGVTNWGLKLLPLAPHLLLQATDLMWTMIFARIFAREKLTCTELAACLGSIVGSCLISLRTHQILPDSFYSIVVNLVSPIFLGLCVTFLRVATRSLLVEHAAIGGKTQNMTPIELSSIKLMISSLTILPFAWLFENGGIQLFTDAWKSSEIPMYKFLMQEGPALFFAAIGGGIFVLMFQVNMTWMSKIMTAVSVGVIGGLKIIPQWLMALIFGGPLDLNVMSICGALVAFGSSLLWTYLRYDNAQLETISVNPSYQSNSVRADKHHKKSILSDHLERNSLIGTEDTNAVISV